MPVLNPATRQELNHFISQTHQVINDLNNAYHLEQADMFTSNNSLAGFFVSRWSNSTNLSIANRVDHLRSQAIRINRILERDGIYESLPTYFSGNGIRAGESNEHSWTSIICGDGYSTYASANTAAEIATARSAIESAQYQAMRIRDNYAKCSRYFAGTRAEPMYRNCREARYY